MLPATPLPHRRAGGLSWPVVSLGLWQNFGATTPFADQRALVLHAVDRGVVHLDLANNYGPPPFAAEESVGRLLARDLRGHRDELLITTKAGYRAWPGPYGEHGSAKYLRASLDESLRRLGVDCVDVFYSHRFDPSTPLDGDPRRARPGRPVGQGAATRGSRRTRPTARSRRSPSPRSLGLRLAVHQPAYSMLNRWVEQPGADGRSLLDVADDAGMAVVAFSPLAQGMLSTRYLHGVPADSRAARGGPLRPEWLTDEALDHVRALDAIARGRRADAAAARARLGAAGPARDVRAGRRAHHRRSSTRTSAAVALPPLTTTSSPRSSRTPSTPGSTCGASRSSDR